MDKLIRQIYEGFDRFPADLVGIDSSEYKEAREKDYMAHEALRVKLPPEFREEFDELIEYDIHLLAVGQEDGFIDGFRLGMKLMIEILT